MAHGVVSKQDLLLGEQDWVFRGFYPTTLYYEKKLSVRCVQGQLSFIGQMCAGFLRTLARKDWIIKILLGRCARCSCAHCSIQCFEWILLKSHWAAHRRGFSVFLMYVTMHNSKLLFAHWNLTNVVRRESFVWNIRLQLSHDFTCRNQLWSLRSGVCFHVRSTSFSLRHSKLPLFCEHGEFHANQYEHGKSA